MKTAAQIIDVLGGSAQIARETGFPLTTIESWKAAEFIPAWRREKLLTLASHKAVQLVTADFPQRRARQSAASAA